MAGKGLCGDGYCWLWTLKALNGVMSLGIWHYSLITELWGDEHSLPGTSQALNVVTGIANLLELCDDGQLFLFWTLQAQYCYLILFLIYWSFSDRQFLGLNSLSSECSDWSDCAVKVLALNPTSFECSDSLCCTVTGHIILWLCWPVWWWPVFVLNPQILMMALVMVIFEIVLWLFHQNMIDSS